MEAEPSSLEAADKDELEAGSIRLPFVWSSSAPATLKAEGSLEDLQVTVQPRRLAKTAPVLSLTNKDDHPILLAECFKELLIHLADQAGVPNWLLPCLSSLSPHLHLEVQSAERSPPSMCDQMLQPMQTPCNGDLAGEFDAEGPRKRSRLAGMQHALSGQQLQDLQAHGVLWVKVKICLKATFFFSVAAAGDEGDGASEDGTMACAAGKYVVQLLTEHLQRRKGLDDPAAHASNGSTGATGGVAADGLDKGVGAAAVNGAHGSAPVSTEDGQESWVPADRATEQGHSVHDEVFEIARPRGWTAELPDPPGLKCQLYRYQRRALAWMAWRESSTGPGLPHDSSAPESNSSSNGVQQSAVAAEAGRAAEMGNGLPYATAGRAAEVCLGHPYAGALRGVRPPSGWPEDSRAHLMWKQVQLQSGHVVWLNPWEGLAARTLPQLDLTPLRGGMLCDEMGLGKTVEVIALMLAHPAPLPAQPRLPATPKQPEPPSTSSKSAQGTLGPNNTAAPLANGTAKTAETSPPSTAHGHRVKRRRTGPTLIVTPVAILQQWAGEIKAHSSLKVEVYQGLRSHVSERRAEGERAARVAGAEVRRLQKAACAVEKQLLRLLGPEEGRGGGAGRAKRRRLQQAVQGSQARDEGRERRSGEAGDARAGSSSRSRRGRRRVSDTDGEVEIVDDEEEGTNDEKERLHVALDAAEAAVREAAAAAEAAQRAAVVSEHEACEEEVERLAQCDVVLTTYTVMSAEVHLSNGAPARLLRHGKRYNAAPSPLLELNWHRIVLDEAQMVGAGLTNVAQMAARLTTTHRWCVTGTPLGAGGLGDIQGSLCALCYAPLDQPSTFWRLVVRPYLSGSKEGFRRLQWALKPIMWRNSKAIASQDLTLPPRSLRNALLAMHPAERAFYQHVLEEARKANAEWLAHQAASSLVDGELHESAQEHRQRLGYGVALSRRAVTQLLQLRLACVHPQLTEYWKQLSNELQLGQGQGGALSVTEMLSRMRDQAQLHLQNEERDFCQAADALAAKLIKQAERLQPSQPVEEHEDSDADMESGGGAGGSGPGAGKALQSPAARASNLRQEALQLLETSYRVGESGIGAAVLDEAKDAPGLDVFAGGEEGGDGRHGLAEDITAAASSWRAWRLVQVRTCQLLAERYTALGRAQDASRMRAELAEKETELQETVDLAIAKGEGHLTSLHQRAHALQHQQLPDTWQQAQEEGFPLSFLDGAMQRPDVWAKDMHTRWEAARALEAEKRVNVLEGANTDEQILVLLGKEVTSLLSSEEGRLTSARQQVEAQFGTLAIGAAQERVRAALQVVDSKQWQARSSSLGAAAEAVQAGAAWCAGRAVEKALPQRVVMMHESREHSAVVARSVVQGWLVPGGDLVGQASVRRWLGHMSTRLRERQTQYQGQDGDGRAAQMLGHCSAAALFKAMDALRMQVDLLRLWREIHVGTLKLEVEASNRDQIRDDVAAAAAGENLRSLPSKNARMSVNDLREKCDALRKSCEELRSRKAYLENQLQSAAGTARQQQRLQQQQAPAQRKQVQQVQEACARQQMHDKAAMPVDGPADGLTTTPVNERIASFGQQAVIAPGLIADGDGLPVGPIMDAMAQTGSTAQAQAVGQILAAAQAPKAYRAPCTCQGPYQRGTGISTQLHAWYPSCACPKGRRKAAAAAATASAAPASATLAGPAQANSQAQEGVQGLDSFNEGNSSAGWHQPSRDVHAPLNATDQSPGPGQAKPRPVPGSPFTSIDLTAAADKPASEKGGVAAADCIDLTGMDGPPAGPSQPRARGTWQRQETLGDEDEEQRATTNVDCSVCLNTLTEGALVMVYTCGHYFCSACSDEILSVPRARCPSCRRDVARNQVFRVVASREGATTGRHNPEIAPPEGKRIMNVKLLGTWMTKLEALLRRLLLLRSTAPDEKALVFSQFPQALELVSKALTVNNVGHVSLARGQRGAGGARDAVARFNTDSSVHVFLLSLHHGAAGLTLVRANHVLMLDVSTDPAVEQQAVARVHRIGQLRPVTITRLLCDGTVEMQVLEALEHKQQQGQQGPTVHVEGELDEDDTEMVDVGQDAVQADDHGQQPMAGTTEEHNNGAGHASTSAGGHGVLSSRASLGGSPGPKRGSSSAGVNRNVLQVQAESALLAGGAPKKETLGVHEAAQLLAQL